MPPMSKLMGYVFQTEHFVAATANVKCLVKEIYTAHHRKRNVP